MTSLRQDIDTETTVSVISKALPYIKKFSGKTMVIKYGGNAMINEQLETCFAEVSVGVRLGGGRLEDTRSPTARTVVVNSVQCVPVIESSNRSFDHLLFKLTLGMIHNRLGAARSKFDGLKVSTIQVFFHSRDTDGEGDFGGREDHGGQHA